MSKFKVLSTTSWLKLVFSKSSNNIFTNIFMMGLACQEIFTLYVEAVSGWMLCLRLTTPVEESTWK